MSRHCGEPVTGQEPATGRDVGSVRPMALPGTIDLEAGMVTARRVPSSPGRYAGGTPDVSPQVLLPACGGQPSGSQDDSTSSSAGCQSPGPGVPACDSSDRDPEPLPALHPETEAMVCRESALAQPKAKGACAKGEREPLGTSKDRGTFDLSVINLTYKVLTRSTPAEPAKGAVSRLCLPAQMMWREATDVITQVSNWASASCCHGANQGLPRGAALLKQKILLSGVCAEARHGEILAVVGPSGAGKSTFLDAVAGKIRRSSLEGEILLNGRPVGSAFRRVSGYVMQDDQLFPMLTVRETLMFSARLRIPSSMSKAEKAARVEAVIQELGLGSCANTLVGNVQVRGVSGGERRRVSIGVDLIHDPAVLFLDEPTSGLDSVAAYSVVQILRNLAEKSQRTVILTIHQPAFRILELIHSFLVLSRGVAVYHGPYEGLARYFRKFAGDAGLRHEANGLEYALDVVESAQEDEERAQALITYAEAARAASAEARKVRGKWGGGAGKGRGRSKKPELHAEYATGLWSEVLTLTDRSLKSIFRTRELFLTRLFTFILAGAIVGSIFFQSPQSPQGVNDRVSFFGFALMAYLFTAVEALPVFLEERQIYIRETSRGAYRTLSYVLAGTIAFVPFLAITALAGSLVPYFMIGLAPGAAPFLTYFAACLLTLAVGNSFVLFIAGFVPNFAIGVTISTAILAFFFLCSGFFIPSSRIPKYWIWLNYLSAFKYPLQMMMLNEFQSQNSTCWDPEDVPASALSGQPPFPAVPPTAPLLPQTAAPPLIRSHRKHHHPPLQSSPPDFAMLPRVSGPSDASFFQRNAAAPGVSDIPGAPVQAPEGLCMLTSQHVLDSYEMGNSEIWIDALVMVGFFVLYRLLFMFLLKWRTMSVRK